MALYLRKSVRVGPFRFNLSKSGIGVSAGIKGFRVGSGPRGNYVHMGRGGVYYRKTFSSGSESASETESRSQFPQFSDPIVPAAPGLQAIESGDVANMVDSSSRDLVEELNSKRRRYSLWRLPVIATAVSTIVATNRPISDWAVYGIILFGTCLSIFTYYKDLLSKTTVILYDLEPPFQQSFEQLHSAFAHLRRSKVAWLMEAEGRVHDSKYHAGANTLVQRERISLDLATPPFVKTNIKTPCIPAGRQTLYFFPDRVLVFEPKGVGAVSYENLEINITDERFIELESLTSDAKVVGTTWKYMNKKGGPDRRFKDNQEIPIALYGGVHFYSTTGLNEKVIFSSINCTTAFAALIRSMANTPPTLDSIAE